MDIFLGKVTQQAMNYAIRSGVTITASYALRQSSKLLSSTPKSNIRDELYRLQQKLQHKIRIVSPAIDLIELIAARGNTSLESAVALVKELRLEIQSLGQRFAKAAEASEQINRKSSKWSSQARAQNEADLSLIIRDIRALLDRIEDAVPLINLAITTSGASLSTQLPQTVSPSRLLQASTFLTAGDTQYSMSPNHAVQIGPTFTLTVYMLFAGHNRPQDEEELRETTWKEVIHKARVKLRRVPLDLVTGSDNIPSADITSPVKLPSIDNNRPSIRGPTRADEYAYQLLIVEDFDDDRVHDFSDMPLRSQPSPFDDVALAGIRETIPVHEIGKIFYADTSKVLNIGSDAESNHPVLLLKRDLNAVPPRRMAERDDATGAWRDGEEGQEDIITLENYRQPQVGDDYRHAHAPAHDDTDPWRLPPSLDPEWIAFEVYTESEPSDSESEGAGEGEAAGGGEDSTLEDLPPTDEAASQLTSHLSSLHLNTPTPTLSPTPTTTPTPSHGHGQELRSTAPPWANKIVTSLSLLELLLRLTSLQQFQQQSHLSITDELLTFFLEESASTGAGGDERYRQHMRMEARRRVGWDPYNESPVKRRGEEYQYQYHDQNRNGDEHNDAYEDRSSYRGGGHGYDSPGSMNDGGRRATAALGWSPTSPRTRDGESRGDRDGGDRMRMTPNPMTPMSPMSSPLPSPPPATPAGKAGRAAWLRRDGDASRKGSPLRPATALTDEGIGTSPVSGADGKR
ncbi:hypothetical protein A1O7_00205 [Cladophialophora yegresii CBS 114405]|uniref:RanGTP-binding protein n=1 Tax=Cladophialophora yegresii CBS 114405 TaxID=1182544 RepID=W9WFW4_9EURO|nr:uncharacterized protein A1O7_00205 [Cladophialophora yegresii CBS 114405]EXJ63870.1 hypothetical protein A1O7_00205 [Cladophialophora yegresii CBS 114405]